MFLKKKKFKVKMPVGEVNINAINAQLGQPFLQAELLGPVLSSTVPPPQNLETLPYAIVDTVDTISAPCVSCDVFVSFVKSWEKKIHPTDLLPNVSYNIAVSMGGSSLCAASFLYAAVKTLSKSVVRVTSYLPPPTYGFYKRLCNQYVRGTEWVSWEKNSDGVFVRPTNIDVVVVISPNNPTGEIVENPVVTSPFLLVDTVYDISLFTGKKASVNPWLWRYLNHPRPTDPAVGMVTSFSKFGFGGFRAGYLFTNKVPVLSLAQNFISTFYFGSPTYLYYLLIKNDPSLNNAFFKSVYCILKKRQEQIRKYIPANLILNVNSVAPYLFVNIDSDKFLACNVIVQKGTIFLFPPTYSRINLMLSTPEWKRLVRILRSGCLFRE